MALMKLYHGTSDLFIDVPVRDGSDYILTDTGRQFIDIGDQRIQLCDQNLSDDFTLKLIEMQALLEHNAEIKALSISYVQHPTITKAIVLDASEIYDQLLKIITINASNFYTDDE